MIRMYPFTVSSPVSQVPLESPAYTQPGHDVAPPPTSVFRKHTSPISFKSLSLIALFLLLGSALVFSQLFTQKESLDFRSRAAKEESSVLKNGSFEQSLLNWKVIKKDNSDTINIVTQSATHGAKAVKLVNTSGKELTLYQDVKVVPSTWYTIRVDGKSLDSNASAKFELREYNLVNGSPTYVKLLFWL